MSLINDALKQVRQASAAEPPPVKLPTSPALQPVANSPVPVARWLIPAVVVMLVVAGVFFVGYAMARHSVGESQAEPTLAAPPVATADAAPAKPTVSVAKVAAVPAPAAPAPVAILATKPAPTATIQPKTQPQLQGIFYSPTAPAAIVDGKTVRIGDQVMQFHVAAISKRAVTLQDGAGRTLKLSMDN